LAGEEFEIASENENIRSPFGGFGVATGDLDNDGAIDLLVANDVDGDLFQVFMNEEDSRSYVKFKLEGTTSNRAAIGAKVSVFAANMWQAKELRSGIGYGAQNSLTMHFGLDDAQSLERVKILWPSGLQQEFNQLTANQAYLIREGGEPENFEAVVTSLALVEHTDFRIIGNPVNEETSILLPQHTEGTFSLNTLNGLQLAVLRTKGETNMALHILSPKIPSGMYLLTFDTGNTRAVIKLLKQ